MVMRIRNEEADRLARQLSALTGETRSEAVTRAMRERLTRLKLERRRRDTALADQMMEMAATIRKNQDSSAGPGTTRRNGGPRDNAG